uniref:Mast cell immunoglobulin like receptor 1 n=1 Tax=Cebus imitator TaxID=2715852 RepID=A0A2K5PQH3_CEBIM
MWSHLNKLLFWAMLSSVTCKNTVLDCKAMKTNEFPPPCLDSETNVVMKGQSVSVFCSHKNKSLQITYSLFRSKTHLGTQDGKGEPVIFNLSITGAHESGPYKCKAQVCNHSKYSPNFNFIIVGGDSCPFCLKLLLLGLLLPLLVIMVVIILILAFWILPKYKARKAMRNNLARDCGAVPMEAGIYANIHQKQAKKESVPEVGSRLCVSTAQDGAGHSQELQYATAVFREVAPRQQEACDYYKPGYVYAELNF